MTDPLAKFPLLFSRRWRARGLDAAIASVNITTLAAEYHGLRGSAPQRALRGKAYFVGHTGTTPGGGTSNRREEHLARALCDSGSRWPWPGGGWLRPLDYQVPLKARQNDAGIGKIDLLGVTDAGRFVVVELKVDGAGGHRSDSPPAALMEALRYAAILHANHSVAASEAKAKFDALVSDEATPAIMLIGTDAWWQSWLTLRAAGLWTAPFARLLNQIEMQIGVPVRCMAITQDDSEPPIERHFVPVDLVASIPLSSAMDLQQA
jgi:Predicted nuclease of the RecB family